MKAFIAPTYTFTPGASGVGTVNLSGISSFDPKFLVAIINQTRGVTIYATGSTALRYTGVSGTTVTLFADTTGQSGSDVLQVIYEDPTATPVSGPLTDAQLRASAFAVNGNTRDGSGNLIGSGTVGGNRGLFQFLLGRTVVNTARQDYVAGNVTTGAWTQLVASLSAEVHEIEIFDSSGQTLEIGTGAAASETRLLLVVPGGNGRVPVRIASGTRISIRAVSATANVGEAVVNFYG